MHEDQEEAREHALLRLAGNKYRAGGGPVDTFKNRATIRSDLGR